MQRSGLSSESSPLTLPDIASTRKGEGKFLAAARNGRVQTVPDAGHACNLDQPEKYNQAVREFARSIGWTHSAG